MPTFVRAGRHFLTTPKIGRARAPAGAWNIKIITVLFDSLIKNLIKKIQDQ